MDSTREIPRNTNNGLCDKSLATHFDTFTQYLTERRYSAHSVSSYQASVSHFACWMKHNRLATKQIDEALVARFLDHHLPRCNCAGLIRRTYTDVRAALGHLLIVLRASAEIAERAQPDTPVDDELRRFDEYMSHVRGLAANTRR